MTRSSPWTKLTPLVLLIFGTPFAAAAPSYGMYINPGAGAPKYGVYDLSGGPSYFQTSVGIATNAPAVALEVAATGSTSAILVPRDTTANRPTGANGMFRYNTTTAGFEGYAGGSWSAFGAGGSGPWSTLSGNVYFTGGNVGVGTNAPVAALDVTGGVRAGSAASVTTCNGANEGIQRYNYTNHAIEWCNGSSWITATSVATTTPPPTGSGGTGYFVMSASTWNGNLGGLAGANAKCRTELATYNWMGKPGTLTSAKIFAWLCDTSACTSPLANTTYYYATANDTSAGGAYFTTSATTDLPNDQYQWNATNRFNAGVAYWANRQNQSSSLTNNGPQYTDTCSNFTDSSNVQATDLGISNATDSNRWQYNNSTCDTPNHLICFLNP